MPSPAAYTPTRLMLVQFPGTKHLKAVRRNPPWTRVSAEALDKPRQADPSQLKALQPLKFARDPYQVPVNLT